MEEDEPEDVPGGHRGQTGAAGEVGDKEEEEEEVLREQGRGH